MPVTLTRTQARALSNLLGQYQELLESDIDGELIPTDQGKVDPWHDIPTCRRLQRDRRRWKACEGFQKILGGETDGR